MVLGSRFIGWLDCQKEAAAFRFALPQWTCACAYGWELAIPMIDSYYRLCNENMLRHVSLWSETDGTFCGHKFETDPYKYMMIWYVYHWNCISSLSLPLSICIYFVNGWQHHSHGHHIPMSIIPWPTFSAGQRSDLDNQHFPNIRFMQKGLENWDTYTLSDTPQFSWTISHISNKLTDPRHLFYLFNPRSNAPNQDPLLCHL